MPGAQVIRLFIVAQVRLYREGLAEVLGRHEGFVVVGTAAHGEHAPEMIANLRPTVVLVDLDMPHGRELIRAIADHSPQTRVVALAVPETDADVLGWAEAGISGYVAREAALTELVDTIESVARGETLASPRIVATLFRHVAVLAARSPRSSDPRLTARETEILALIGRGLSNKEIADRLVIELPTVKNHVHNLLEKLNVHRRSEAAALWRGEAMPRRELVH
jgi:two-component system nitrate/nitrite response regulator NarL